MHAEFCQTPFSIMHFKFFILYVKYVYGLQDIGGDLQDFTLQCAFAIQSKFLKYAHLQWVLLYLAIKFLNMFIPVENLTYLSSITKKGEIVSASSAP